VERHAAPPSGRGRPAWLYTATGRDVEGTPEYAGLASALAATLHRTSAAPAADAEQAGEAWGRELARGRGAAPAGSPVAARREVVAMLDELGFAPFADARTSVVKLTRCPLLEAAHRYPDVVCSVHLGLVRGALSEYGGDTEGTELVPFAEPGSCRLRLAGPRR
jgi:predicted ArsR family transcriptional regulator